MKPDTRTVCRCHAAPVADGAILCPDGASDLAKLLGKLTPMILRGDREPARDDAGRIIPGGFGRGTSTDWDTPSGEVSNLPRMLDEQAARLAVRRGLVIGRTPMAEAPLPLDLRAVNQHGRIRQILADMTGQPLDGWWTLADAAAWLLDNLEELRHWDGAWDAYEQLRKAVDRAERAVDLPAERHYLGPCDLTTGCPGHVWATDTLPGACTHCRTQVDQATRRADLLHRASGLWMTAREIEKITATFGQRVPSSNVVDWATRSHVASTGTDPTRYLLADVLAHAEKVVRRPGRARRAG